MASGLPWAAFDLVVRVQLVNIATMLFALALESLYENLRIFLFDGLVKGQISKSNTNVKECVHFLFNANTFTIVNTTKLGMLKRNKNAFYLDWLCAPLACTKP
jgi:hypothetical protein